MAQHGIQALLLDVRLGAAAMNGQRVVQGAADRVCAESGNAARAGFLGQFDGGRGADDHPAAFFHQPTDLAARFLQIGVGGLADVHGEQRGHARQFRVRLLEADHADPGGVAARQVQRADQVVLAHVDRQHGGGQVLAQVVGGGGGTDEGIDGLAFFQASGQLQCAGQWRVDYLDAGAVGVVRHDPLDDPRHPARTLRLALVGEQGDQAGQGGLGVHVSFQL
ncbi:hypothetical protein D3C81_1258680 [compost metagenome]